MGIGTPHQLWIRGQAFAIQAGVAWHFHLCITLHFLVQHRAGYEAPIISMALAAGTGIHSAPCLSFSHLAILSTLFLLVVVARYPQYRCRGGFSAICESVNANTPHHGACVRSGMGHISTVKLACASLHSAECPRLVQGQSIAADLPHSMHHRFSPIDVASLCPVNSRNPRAYKYHFKAGFPKTFSPMPLSCLVCQFQRVVLCPTIRFVEFRLLQRPRSRRGGQRNLVT
jgi:hypothetical protein